MSYNRVRGENMDMPSLSEIEIYRKRTDSNDFDIKCTYIGNFIVTSIFPKMIETEKQRQRTDITENILEKMRSAENNTFYHD